MKKLRKFRYWAKEKFLIKKRVSFLNFVGNFVADIMRMAMQTDIALLNGGTLRSDRIHLAGSFTLKVGILASHEDFL